MNIRLLGLLTAFAMSSPAFALDGFQGSGWMHNTPGKKIEAKLGVAYTSIKKTLEEGQLIKNYKGTGHTEQLMVEYGINNNLSAGVLLGMYKISVTPDPDTFFGKFEDKGMQDPQVYVHYRMDMGPGSLRFGGMLGIGMGTHTMSSDFGENAYAGASWINPWVGYEALMGDHAVGTKLSYSMFLSDRKFHRDASIAYPAFDSTGKGGETTFLDAFYEYSISGQMLVGLNLNYTNVATTKETISGTTTDSQNGSAGLGETVYFAWASAMTETQFLIINPFVQMGPIGNGMNGNTKTSTTMNIGTFVTYLF